MGSEVHGMLDGREVRRLLSVTKWSAMRDQRLLSCAPGRSRAVSEGSNPQASSANVRRAFVGTMLESPLGDWQTAAGVSALPTEHQPPCSLSSTHALSFGQKNSQF